MTSANPFSYLQRNADDDPRGVFSRSADAVVTNAEAAVLAKKIAFELRRLGVRSGDVVALALPDPLSIVFTEAVYHEAAISTVLPPGFAPSRGFDVDWIFASGAVPTSDRARVVEVDVRFLQRIEENPYGIRPSDEPIETVRIVFSSGTTGTPKAIALGRDMEATFDAALETWSQSGPSLILMGTGSPWGFGEFFLSVKTNTPFLCAGGADQAGIARLAAQNGVRALQGSPTQFAALVDELEATQVTLPSVERVIVAGMVMPPGVAERMRRATDGCAIFGSYGSTEAGGAAMRLYESDDPYDAGRILPGAVVEIVDEEDATLSPGSIGRIRYRAPGMVHAYLGDPDATAAVFREGWFYPGDLGFLRPDGGLTLAGREAELLNAGGIKVDPTRIDHAALRAPGVTAACSFAYAGASEVGRIGLALVARDDVDVAALASALAAEFGSAAPQLIARVEEIPLTRTGKPMRWALAERFRES